jgi:hypothetical protein
VSVCVELHVQVRTYTAFVQQGHAYCMKSWNELLSKHMVLPMHFG